MKSQPKDSANQSLVLIRTQLRECLAMSPEYVKQHGGEQMRRLGISDLMAEEVILLMEGDV